MTGVTRRLQVVDDNEQQAMLKVAFATADRRSVDQHFGSARSFVIYGVNPERAFLQSVCEFTEFGADASDDKLAAKLALLEGCIAVYCRACGASAVRQLLALGIQPVKVTEGALIDDLLDALCQELREGPSAWLAKAIRQQRQLAKDYDSLGAGEWSE